MKTLVLVLDGEASRDNVAVVDVDRPLTPRGRCQNAAAAGKFASLGYQVDAIVASPALRAVNTANIWQKTLKIQAERLSVLQDIYEAERTDLLRIVQQLDDTADTVVLVGHNPGVTAFLHYLVGRTVEMMASSAFAVIAIDVDRWSQIALRHCEQVHYYVPPAASPLSPWRRLTMWCRQRVQKVEIFTLVAIVVLVILAVAAVAIYLNVRAK
jgi:phosphohistidine phosphatase